jgi:hypothetical protein
MDEVIKYLEEIKEHQMQTVQLARSTEVYKLANKALKAIEVIRCSTQLKDKKTLSFEDWYITYGYSKRNSELFIKNGTRYNLEEMIFKYENNIP